MATDFSSDAALLAVMVELRQAVVREATQLVDRWRPHLRARSFAYSVFNLACYLALRRRDLRGLQRALVPLGLSSLGRCEGHVLASLDAVIAALAAITRSEDAALLRRPSFKHFTQGEGVLERNAGKLLGAGAANRRVRIMVTLPLESAEDYGWVCDVVRRGANCLRINCAHDSPEVWLGMIGNVRRAEKKLGRKCAVLMDLCGPRARVGTVRLADPEQRVRRGDKIFLSHELPKTKGGLAFQGVCSIPAILDQLRPGAVVWMNEGKIGSRVMRRKGCGLILEVTHAREKGENFRADMGLNFPGSVLKLSPLTEKDVADLDFVCRHADAVGYSFVQEPEDMDRLRREIGKRRSLRKGRSPLGVVAKIETARAVTMLPELIVRGAGAGPFGVMIARGDLAVEIGYLRIAEIQEEILWVCQAAHVPVVWATQVLESFAKKGIPSRAEITDAAMAERAECVMLNKGPFIPGAISILAEVLEKMQAHQSKKMATFRALRSWDHLWTAA